MLFRSTGSDSSTTNANINNYGKNVESSTPQGQLSIAAKGIDTVDYADKLNFTHNDNSENASTSSNTTANASGSSSSNSTGNVENNENEVIEEHIKGNYGQVSSQSLIEHYRELIVNVEQKIINDERIRELFMQIW